MTATQEIVARDNRGKSRQYDMISIFGLRPPELVTVFENPKHYFRLCYIDDRVMSEEKMKEGLDSDLSVCHWIDCLCRRIFIRKNALYEIELLLEQSGRNNEDNSIEDDTNMSNLTFHDYCDHPNSVNDEDENPFPIRSTILKMIRVYNTPDEYLNSQDVR